MERSTANSSGVLFITSYPPRECGIATFSQDLVTILKTKFSRAFSYKVCALEWEEDEYTYPEEVVYTLNTSVSEQYEEMAEAINRDSGISAVVLQHEFGLFFEHEEELQSLLFGLSKPVVLSLHTVLPDPEASMKHNVQSLVSACESVIVMTNYAAELLANEYGIPRKKTTVIPHGTHLVHHEEKSSLKEQYGLTGRKVLSTFGLLCEWKSIETTLDALPAIVSEHPEVLFLVLGKTHPRVLEYEGERYRNMLEAKVEALKLQDHVQFVNRYLPRSELLEYLQLTDIYLFTSKNPGQAVSGTFVYAMACGCPVISTRFPHAEEVLTDEMGALIDFEDSEQLGLAVNRLLADEPLRKRMSLNALQKTTSGVWENAAIAHARLLTQVAAPDSRLNYDMPPVNLQHLKKMTTEFGIVRNARINHPDPASGYVLDNNAEALVALVQHYEQTRDEEDLSLIQTYLNFLAYCQQPEGDFLNYVSYEKSFTAENNSTSLEDANGRAVWALGFLISREQVMPETLVSFAETMMQRILPRIEGLHSPRSMAFAIKGLHYYNKKHHSFTITAIVRILADRLIQLYMRESDRGWEWFESYLTYANSVLPEAVLYAYTETGDPVYKEIAAESFNFLLSTTFNEGRIKVISNKSWLYRGEEAAPYGEQPIDVAYTILTLNRFYKVFKERDYLHKMEAAFNWFLGDNHLHKIIYNPCTGGCYDGLEEDHVNLNQGAEATISYLMARLTMEDHAARQVTHTPPPAATPTSIRQPTNG